MFINGLLFFVTISRTIKFRTQRAISDKRKITYLKCAQLVVQVYRSAGFIVNCFLMDLEFECLREDLLLMNPPVELNTAVESEHVPEIERDIRLYKGRIRAMRTTMPYRCIPREVIRGLVRFVILWLNAFPLTDGLTTTLSPRTIMTRRLLDFKMVCRIPFGAYAQIHKNNTPLNNTEAPRTLGAISLGPTGNVQGG